MSTPRDVILLDGLNKELYIEFMERLPMWSNGKQEHHFDCLLTRAFKQWRKDNDLE